jgi:hypothetical protein
MKEVFVAVEEKMKPSFNVGVIFKGALPQTADLGIEIEVEGHHLPKSSSVPAPWVYHVDHSLRGADNGEYVLSRPIKFDETDKTLKALWDAFKACKTKIDESNRTSVHVHLNCQGFHLNRLASFAALYFCFEEILTQWCGEHRVGNLFCLRAIDAPAIVTHFKKFLKADGQYKLYDNLHYSGMNFQALAKYGSIEIRSLRGVSDPKVIIDWVNILRRLYDLSAEYTDPRGICEEFSANGPIMFFNSILGEQSTVVRSVVPWTDDQIRDSMYEGLRLAQDLCYCKDWSGYKDITIKPDPFGRDVKKIAKKMMGDNYLSVAEAFAVTAPPPLPILQPTWEAVEGTEEDIDFDDDE